MSWLVTGKEAGPLGLLDQYGGAAVAYSLRNLSLYYFGPVVRVRRNSDNAEQDFTAAQVTDGTLTTFCGAGNGFVRTWYDQSGNGYHAANSSTGEQPQIVSSGALITEGSKPAILFDGSNDSLDANSAASLFTGTDKPLHSLVVFKSNVTNSAINRAAWSVGRSASDTTLRWVGQNQLTNNSKFDQRNDANTLTTLTGGTATSQALVSAQGTAASSILRVNGVQVSTGAGFTGAATLDQFSIGCLSRTNKVIFWSGLIQELVLYPANMTASQGELESNISAHYSIY